MQFQISRTIKSSVNDLLVKCEFIKSKKKNNKVEYANLPASFDIEVSSFYDEENNKCACMYIYVLGINGKVKIGRTWEEFKKDIDEIIKYYNVTINRRFIIYVHNLAYEFQFIRKLFDWDEVVSLDLRKPVYARTVDGIEFRCSYILSNLSLAKVGENLLKYKVEKMKGDLDYELVRHSKTPLTNKELGYVINDGLIVMCYIQELIEVEGNINKIPLTSTGFVRVLCKENCIVGKDKYDYRQLIRKLTMTPEQYLMLKQAYQGGFTHANSWRVNRTLYKVSSYDFTSSYPTTLISEKYPMSSGIYLGTINQKQLERAIDMYACLFEITFYNLDDVFIFEHYISQSKCLELEGEELNNGRVARAKKVTMIITELDYKIIRKNYKWDKIEIRNFTVFIKNYLPTDLVKTILKLYSDKTELKGIEGKENEYMRAKSLINSCYGMCVTDPCKDSSLYDSEEQWHMCKNDLVKQIETYNKSWSRFLFYAWGIWCTAYARYNLWTGIFELGKDYVYSDTDSLKILNRESHLDYFETYNKNIIDKMYKALDYHKLDRKLLSPKNIKGETKMLGIWDYEGTYDMFKTLGAKRYILKKGYKIEITISGVNKKNGSEYLINKYKEPENIFNNFQDNLEFPGEYLDGEEVKNANGKMTHTYIDIERKGYVIDYLGNKGYYDELTSVHMEKCDYNMSLSEIFKNYLQGIKEGFIL